MKISIWNALLQTACSSTARVPQILFIFFAGYRVMEGNLTISAFVAFFNLINLIVGPTVYFPFLLNGLNNSIASINRIKSMENIPQNGSIEKVTSSNTPEINMNNICFGYSDDNLILQDFSLFHSGNGIIAICGESGSGKTTILDLIAGLYPPKCGRIDVNGNISVVSQDTYIFNASLLENVRMAKINATDEEVIKALKIAGADKFAMELPNGYYTMLGEGNSDLSGGQKQRISLARTILTNSSIWLLDEPTSALDIQTENIILDVIRKMSKEKLIIISAHRQSIIGIAGKVVRLSKIQAMKGVEIF